VSFIDTPYSVERAHADLYVELVGPADGRPLFYLHGGPGYNSFSFRDLLGDDLESYRTLYADQRGSGRSYHDAPFGLDELALDVLAILDSLELPPAVLVAHGFGALIAVRAALRSPERVAGTVLINPWLSMPLLAQKILREAEAISGSAFEREVEGMSGEQLANAAFSLAAPKLVLDTMQFPLPASRLRLEHSDSASLSGPSEPRAPEGMWELDGLDDLAAAPQPTVLIVGRQDRTCFPEQAELALERRSDALVSLLDSGHYPWLDDPETFVPLLHESLTVVGDSG
jgi:proline iminopeptidase